MSPLHISLSAVLGCVQFTLGVIILSYARRLEREFVWHRRALACNGLAMLCLGTWGVTDWRVPFWLGWLLLIAAFVIPLRNPQTRFFLLHPIKAERQLKAQIEESERRLAALRRELERMR